MLKKFFPSLSLFFLLFSFFSLPSAEAAGNHFFYGETCPHCHTVLEYFEEHKIPERYNIELLEVWSDRTNAALFVERMQELGEDLEGRLPVPILILGDQVISGDTPIISYFDHEKELGHWPELPSDLKTGSNLDPDSGTQNQVSKTPHTFWGFFPILSMAALADAVNPCAFAVLIILLLSILVVGDRKRVLGAGLAFSLAIFLSYLAMGFGLYSALATWASTRVISLVAGVLAVVLGVFNLKDVFWYGKGGWKMEVPEKWRGRMKLILAQVTSIPGAFLVGFLISLFLLPCTSGPYIVILGLLSSEADFTCASQCLTAYNAIFVLPMVLITIAVYLGLDPKLVEKIRTRNLPTLHLIIGLLLIGIGLWALLG